MFKNVCFICCLWWRVCDKSRNRRLRDILARNRLDWCYLTALEASPLVLLGNTSLACFLPKYHVTFCSGYKPHCKQGLAYKTGQPHYTHTHAHTHTHTRKWPRADPQRLVPAFRANVHSWVDIYKQSESTHVDGVTWWGLRIPRVSCQKGPICHA